MASPLTTYIHWLADDSSVPFPEECKSLKISSILSLAEEDPEASIVLNQLFNNVYAYNYSIEDIAKIHKRYNQLYRFNYIPVKPIIPKAEPVKKKEVKDVVVNKKTKYKLYAAKEKENSSPTDGYSKPMLFNFYSDYANKEFAYVIRVDDKRYIQQTDDMVMMYTGKDDYMNVHDITGLKGDLVKYSSRKYIIEQIMSESSTKAIYNVDFNLAIQKNYLWKKNNPDVGNYKLRVNYVDIELYQEGYGIVDFADLRKSTRQIPVNLITLYDNYTDKYYTLVYNLNKATIKVEQIKE